MRATPLRWLYGLSLFDDLPEVRRQAAVVASQHLVKGPLRSFGRLPGMLFVIGGPDLAPLHLDLQLSHHRPRSTPSTTLDSSCADAEKMTVPRSFRSVAMGKPWPGRIARLTFPKLRITIARRNLPGAKGGATGRPILRWTIAPCDALEPSKAATKSARDGAGSSCYNQTSIAERRRCCFVSYLFLGR